MKRIIQKTSHTNEEKLKDLLLQTEPNGDCLEWVRCFNTDGYPRMGGNVKVHRLVYELVSGENISGLLVRHTCDNIKCINPDHLLKGTPADNSRDMVERGRNKRVITKEIIHKVKSLLLSKALYQREIAHLIGIDIRRVSDINRNKYSDDGKFLGH